jgi:hypothetical protein
MMPENLKRLTDKDWGCSGCLISAVMFITVACIMSITIGSILEHWLRPSAAGAASYITILLTPVNIYICYLLWQIYYRLYGQPPDRNTDLNDWEIKAEEKKFRFRGRELSSQYYSRKTFPNGFESESLTIYKTEAGKYILLIDDVGRKKIITYDSPKDLIKDLYGLYPTISDNDTKRALLMEAVGRDPGFRSIINTINSEFPAPVLSTNKNEVIEIE